MSNGDFKKTEPRRRMSGPMGPMAGPGEKARNFKASFQRLLRYLRPHKANLIVVLIFAIASTSFSIAAPKVMAKATNKLQDAYMSRTMLEKMAEGQTAAINEMNSKMGEAQQEAVDQIINRMDDAQQEAVGQVITNLADAQQQTVDQVTTQMGDAQEQAVNAIYDAMTASFYSGMVTGQKKADTGICNQMATVQKSLVAQIQQQMAQAQSNPDASQSMDPALAATFQELLALPMIDDQKTLSQKIKVTLQFIAVLEKMPDTSGQVDKASLAKAKAILQLPLLGTLQDPAKKVTVIKQFIKLTGADLPFDRQTMAEIYDRIPSLKAGGTGNDSEMANLDKDAQQAVEDLLDLPMLNHLADPTRKTKTLVRLIKVFQRLPALSDSDNDSAIDPEALDTLLQLVQLPSIAAASDEVQQTALVLRMIDILQAMPDSVDLSAGSTDDTGSSTESSFTKEDLDTIAQLLRLPSIAAAASQEDRVRAVLQMIDVLQAMPDSVNLTGDSASGDGSADGNTADDPAFAKDSLDTIAELLRLPMLATALDDRQKTALVLQMLDIFAKMPDIQTTTETGSGSQSDEAMDPKNIETLRRFLQLPSLATLSDPAEKAAVCRQIMDLGQTMQDTMSGVSTGTATSVTLTDEQVDNVLSAIEETNGQYDFHYIGTIALILIAMYLISAGFSLIMGLVMSGVAQKTSRDLRREVDAKLNRLPLKYFDSHSHGDVLSRVTNDIDTIANTLQQSLTQIITSVITIVGYIFMMLTISPILTLIVIATLPLYILATATIARKSQKYFADQQKQLGDLSGHVEEMYTGHKIVKAFGHESDSIARFKAINTGLKAAGWRAQFISGIMFPLMNFISNLGYVGISIFGGIWITKGVLGLGDILAFIQYSRSFTMPIVQTANIANIIQSTIACAERVFEVLDEREEIPDSPTAVTLANPKGEVSFQQVDFRYQEDSPLITNMNLEVRQGHTVAIVGPTGAGKTTLVNLLMRFYEINAGQICIDGIDIREIRRSGLRKLFGMVLQDTWLFNGTILDNIAYSKEGATQDEIVQAARAAHADHFIRTLPEGYQTVLNEEASNISQGQKQLLTIARAILADPAILILDEATSSVDTRTEVLIQQAMARLMEGRTSFVIAHRLSTIRNAELILVMNKGSIIEMGSHQQLLDQGGFYADLYNSQFVGADLDGTAG